MKLVFAARAARDVSYPVAMNKLALLAVTCAVAACGKDSGAGGAGGAGGPTLAQLVATADAPAHIRDAVPADVAVGRPLKVTVVPPPPAAPASVKVETCVADPSKVFVPLGEWVAREHPGAFRVTGTTDLEAHWEGGEIRGYSDRGNGCAAEEWRVVLNVYHSKH
jgi:hypothetical protein